MKILSHSTNIHQKIQTKDTLIALLDSRSKSPLKFQNEIHKLLIRNHQQEEILSSEDLQSFQNKFSLMLLSKRAFSQGSAECNDRGNH
jgi:hypothetical protein